MDNRQAEIVMVMWLKRRKFPSGKRPSQIVNVGSRESC